MRPFFPSHTFHVESAGGCILERLRAMIWHERVGVSGNSMHLGLAHLFFRFFLGHRSYDSMKSRLVRITWALGLGFTCTFGVSSVHVPAPPLGGILNISS